VLHTTNKAEAKIDYTQSLARSFSQPPGGCGDAR
jgi:hypothetical protein